MPVLFVDDPDATAAQLKETVTTYAGRLIAKGAEVDLYPCNSSGMRSLALVIAMRGPISDVHIVAANVRHYGEETGATVAGTMGPHDDETAVFSGAILWQIMKKRPVRQRRRLLAA